MKNTIVGIDLAKNSFYVHIADSRGKMLAQKKRLSRSALRKFAHKLEPTVVALEACGGAHHWGRELTRYGHEVRVIAPQFVKPYVKADKNDAKDAAAIAEAASRQHMNFVPIKNLAQQDLKMLHAIRERLVTSKVRLTNEIRGIFLEYGVVANKGDGSLKKKMLAVMDVNAELVEGEEITGQLRKETRELYEELVLLEKKIHDKTKEIQSCCKADETASRLLEIPGIGPMTASALVAHVGNAKTFKSGRQFAAYLGLTPREHSTGGKTRLMGISKRGDKTLRTLLIHGARALIAGMRYVKKDKFADWMKNRSNQLRWAHGHLETKGMNKTAVALANKQARIAWAIMARGSKFEADHKSVRSRNAA